MREIPIHFLPILAAAVVRMAIGALWYSPVLFLPTWHRVSGVSEAEMKSEMARAVAIDFVGSLIMAFVLLHAVKYAGAESAAQGMAVGFFNWLGFIAVVTIGTVTYLRKPFQLFLVQNGYLLLSLLAMGAILAVWG
ncbi:MAG TPA: DUF1761 domain-containing protein [Verrucomicrobiae bacterium]|jgi:Protein of unknown function (DUF1761)|nr:DUF1761 domain-containing protein [Verrucomicrobiae bacterium]